MEGKNKRFKPGAKGGVVAMTTSCPLIPQSFTSSGPIHYRSGNINVMGERPGHAINPAYLV